MRRIGLAVLLTLRLTLAPVAEPQEASNVSRIGYLGLPPLHDRVGGFEVVS